MIDDYYCCSLHFLFFKHCLLKMKWPYSSIKVIRYTSNSSPWIEEMLLGNSPGYFQNVLLLKFALVKSQLFLKNFQLIHLIFIQNRMNMNALGKFLLCFLYSRKRRYWQIKFIQRNAFCCEQFKEQICEFVLPFHRNKRFSLLFSSSSSIIVISSVTRWIFYLFRTSKSFVW